MTTPENPQQIGPTVGRLGAQPSIPYRSEI
jgi:hypothetical protein